MTAADLLLQPIVTEVVEVARLLRGETQTALAQAIGISKQNLTHKIKGRNPWTLQDIERLAAHYAMPPESFLRPASVSSVAQRFATGRSPDALPRHSTAAGHATVAYGAAPGRRVYILAA